MKIAIVVLIVILLSGIQNFLSQRDHFIWGLLLPASTVIGCVLFLIFIAQEGTIASWIFKFALLLGINLEIYSEGRKKVKDKNKRELNKMAIKDL